VASWREVEEQAPELASFVRERFEAHRHKTMATLRRDGSPRISGTEVDIRDGQMWLGMMHGALRADDLRRDPRVAVHSGSDEPDGWRGDAKVSGRAVEVTDPEELARASSGETPAGPFHLFRLELREVAAVRLGEPAEFLVIESWHEGRGVRRVERR
jgi:hypothetical protein